MLLIYFIQLLKNNMIFEVPESDKHIFIGVDEVGYGSISGPLVVCGVKAPKYWTLEGLNDSKKL